MVTVKKSQETKNEEAAGKNKAPQILRMEKKQMFCDNDLISLFMGLLRIVKNSVYAEFETKIIELNNEILKLKAENKAIKP